MLVRWANRLSSNNQILVNSLTDIADMIALINASLEIVNQSIDDIKTRLAKLENPDEENK